MEKENLACIYNCIQFTIILSFFSTQSYIHSPHPIFTSSFTPRFNVQSHVQSLHPIFTYKVGAPETDAVPKIVRSIPIVHFRVEM
jgi:hypothetical protein